MVLYRALPIELESPQEVAQCHGNRFGTGIARSLRKCPGRIAVVQAFEWLEPLGIKGFGKSGAWISSDPISSEVHIFALVA